MNNEQMPNEPNLPSANAPARGRRSCAPKAHLQPAFLEEYKKTENQTLAARAVGVDPTTVSRWKKNKAFMKLFTEAHIEAQSLNNDGMKKTALELGISGNPHYVVDRKTGKYVLDDKGQPVVLYREFYPNLTQFLLKNRLPDEFKDKFEHEVSGQLIVTLASEFLAIVRKHVPLEQLPAIQKELETLSAKLINT